MTESLAPYQVESPPPPDQPVAPTFAQILVLLHDRYSNCFPAQGADPKPLKIGVHKDLLARDIPDGVSKMQLRHFLNGYTKSFRYRKVLAKGGSRVDLDGHPCGEITTEQAEHAKASLKPKEKASSKLPAQRPQAAALNPLPTDAPLTEDNIVPGRLEVTIKFTELPKAVQVQAGYKFGLDCDGKPVVVVLKPKHWNKLTQAAAEYPQWIAALTGKMGPSQGNGFVLAEPSLQVFERKPKVPEPAVDTAPPPAAAPGSTADSTPSQAASTPPPVPPASAAAEPSRPAKPKLSLKR